MSWVEQAKCKEADVKQFFPQREIGHNVSKTVRKYCEVCPVKQQCLDFAMSQDEIPGIWGGVTRLQRRSFKSRWNKLQRIA
jgi:WhiB family redox-sensing transcriptional regulator